MQPLPPTLPSASSNFLYSATSSSLALGSSSPSASRKFMNLSGNRPSPLQHRHTSVRLAALMIYYNCCVDTWLSGCCGRGFATGDSKSPCSDSRIGGAVWRAQLGVWVLLLQQW